MWIFNPATSRFDYSKEFSELGTHWSDPRTKTIVTFGTGGMAGALHTADRYEVDGEHLLLIYSEEQDWDADRKQFHCVVKESSGNALTTVFDDWSDNPSQACDGTKASPPSTRIKVDAVVQARRLISQVAPVIPPGTPQVRGVSRTVQLHVIIDKSGAVSSVLVSPAGFPFPPFIKPAMDAVRQWRYTPTTDDGIPVEVETDVTVTFPADQ